MTAYASLKGVGLAGGQPRSNWLDGLGRVFGPVASLFSSLRAAIQATARFQELNRTPDPELIARGLSRSELCRAVYEESFGRLDGR